MAKIEGKVKEVLENTEVVVIGTCGEDGPHLVATWGDYVRAMGPQDDDIILAPAGGYSRTEENLSNNSRVEVLIASKQVGTGFRLSGRGEVQTSGRLADLVKSEFSWARGALVIRVDNVECLL